MPRRQKPPSSSAFSTSKQRSLLEFLSSSPPSSPSSQKSPPPGSPSPSKRKRTRGVSSSSSSHSNRPHDTDSDVGAIHFEPEAIEVPDEELCPRRPKQRKSLGVHAVPVATMSDDSPEETIKMPRRRRKNKIVVDSEDDARPRKRKLMKGVRPPTPEGDGDDVLDAKNLLESRLRPRSKMTAFQKSLQKLKGKKHGKVMLSPSSESEQSERSKGTPFKGSRPHHSGESGASQDEADNTEEDEDDFIIDDDVPGVPALQLPPAFSLSTHQDLTHHFKIICQLFVHMAVRPLADRRPFLERALKEEEYFSVPLQVARRKLSGMRDSLVASSVWRPNFKKGLETYPELTLVPLDFAVPQCDACHLGGRLSTFLGRLNGKPYDAYDFEALSDDESDKTSEEESDADKLRQEINLGKFCATRTRVYHQFCHWEFSLYKTLRNEIVEARNMTRGFVKVGYGQFKPPRDLYDADRVMEWLDKRGIIEAQWQKVRQMMDRARNLERGEMDDERI